MKYQSKIDKAPAPVHQQTNHSPSFNLNASVLQRRSVLTIQPKSDANITPPQYESPTEQNKTGLPDALKAGVENLSGIDMSDTRVHFNSDKPAQINALAYAQGTDIHLGAGQEQHLAHEAWHVVQQKQGRVIPTLQMKGLEVNMDRGLENEADIMGEKALSIGYPQREPLLSRTLVKPAPVLQNRSKLAIQMRPNPPQGYGVNPLFFRIVSSFPLQALNINEHAFLSDEPIGTFSNIPLEACTIQIFNAQDIMVHQINSGEVMGIPSDVLRNLGAGHYTVRAFATGMGNGSRFYQDIDLTLINESGGLALHEELEGSTYLGSHWTSTAYDGNFARYGLLERGEAQSRFGEGFYLTTDDHYGWQAGRSKIQDIGAGVIGQWGVFLRPGQQFVNQLDGNTIPEHQFENPPWRGTEREIYITQYDTIYDKKEKEIKVNKRAFHKINIVKLADYSPMGQNPFNG